MSAPMQLVLSVHIVILFVISGIVLSSSNHSTAKMEPEVKMKPFNHKYVRFQPCDFYGNCKPALAETFFSAEWNVLLAKVIKDIIQFFTQTLLTKMIGVQFPSQLD
ncbi:hypothetical protein HDE_11239 [Halotydeus destructor]|nr:hypothetical protein HDE_11239 [Halotydeus destructor]